MEIGAVKQAFNNELILLKKKLNQAKTQIIHKLTRKAKQLTEKKKVPETIQEKFRKKAENAVKEVLIMKKIKVRDVGRFIVTHKGNLQDYLNRPQMDNDKACARILLHKTMQEKYKYIRNRFNNIPIKDLFMSRNERLKIKKEEKMKQKEKRERKKAKIEKKNVVNKEGDWEVEDVELKESIAMKPKDEAANDDLEENLSDNEDNEASEHSESEDQAMSEEDQKSQSEEDQKSQSEEDSDDEKSVEDDTGKGFKISFKGESDEESENDDSSNEKEVSNDEESSEEEVKLPSKRKPEKINTKEKELPVKNKANVKKKKPLKNIIKSNENDTFDEKEFKLKLGEKKNTVKQDKKQKESIKNKNLQEKILHKKFKKDSDDTNEVEKKVVDPFFVTASGENYMSVVEPRQPDEIKEAHRQGNRAYRRAVMFGNVPKNKPRPSFRQEDSKFDRQNAYGKRPGNFDQQNGYSRNNNKDDNRGFNNNKFNNKNDVKGFNNRFDDSKKPRFNDRNDRKPQEDSKPEKLHPSWEAKKKQSGILPFQGKKIVFDEN